MSQQQQLLRQRYSSSSGGKTNIATATSRMGSSSSSYNGGGGGNSNLNLQHMLKTGSPQQTGTVQKLHISPLLWILPTFIQNWILRYQCLNWFLLRPYWKTRFLVLLGSYLYKFDEQQETNDRPSSSHDQQQQQQQPKGSPWNIRDVNARLVGDDDGGGAHHPHDAVVIHCLDLLMQHDDGNDGHQQQQQQQQQYVVVCISTLRKRTYLACSNRDEANTWVNSIREAKQESITRSMGHANIDSYPQSWQYYDRFGEQLEQQKNRIRHRMEQSHIRELEMNSLAEGGPLPRGYFG